MRRVRKRGANKEKVFGCDLLEHLNATSQEIPLVLKYCSEFVETYGIVDGIYRLSGVSSNIQKLRGDFESDGSPDLNKDVYLQDIHCVSSLCKAYFRELPNPLLTYQLYDKFAEAVAIQLEEERLVKIGDVLKELPAPHFRTLEFLMRHLVRMASYSSETNMHARNLAIVWAPNLLRSKDIETSGFNGTAAFMEVRVQSIVVEFILTHVPQLFPDLGESQERSPSPTEASCQDEGSSKSALAHPANYGNISPGDGPLRMTPYHAIIEGTDKRKGSLKGRKWMSIFNIGGRFPDPRRRHKHSTKEKDRPTLRPARSMDSLSSPGYPSEGSRSSSQRPPTTNISKPSPCITASPKPGSEVAGSTGGMGVTEYSVTYRRGTGLVSGGAGTQGTYTSLDPDNLGAAGNEVHSRSPGMSTKTGRRAAMHITAPNKVTVPLHITSNLVLGVMQGGGADKVIHRGWDKNGGDRVENKEGGEKAERKENKGVDVKVEGHKKTEEEEKNHKAEDVVKEGGVGVAEKTAGDEGGEEKDEKKKEEVREETGSQSEPVNRSESTEHLTNPLTSNTEEERNEEEVMDNKDIEESDEYMDMTEVKPADSEPTVPPLEDDLKPDPSDAFSSTGVEGDDLGLSGYVEDNFEFLDHMDCSGHFQANEFSVEPPGYSDDEYEVMVRAQPCHPAVVLRPGTETRTRSVTESTPQRPTSLDIHNRHTKSLSLPYMTSPVAGPEDSCSEEEEDVELSEDSDMPDFSSDDDENMFVKSLPLDFILNDLRDSDPQDSCARDREAEHQLQSCEEKGSQTLNLESPKKESTVTDQEQPAGVKEHEEEDGLQEKVTEDKEKEENRESTVMAEDHSVVEDTPPQTSKEHHAPSEASTHCCDDKPPLSIDDSSTVPDSTVEQEEEVVDPPRCHADSCVAKTDSGDALQEELRDVSVPEQPISPDGEDTLEREGDEGDDRKEEVCPDTAVNEHDGDISEGGTDEDDKVKIDEKHEEAMEAGDKEQDDIKCGTNDSIWDELEEVVCEVIEDEEERERAEGRAAGTADGEGITEENDTAQVGEEEQMGEIVEDGLWEVDGGEIVTDGREEEVQVEIRDSSEVNQGEEEGNSAKTSEPEAAFQEKLIITEDTDKEKENNNIDRANDQQRPPTGADVVRVDLKKPMDSGMCEKTSLGGVGRKLVVSKNPKIHQVKAVPVVPPKPQHCKITALTLRQQQQQRERREAEERERERETSLRVPFEHFRAPMGEKVRDEDEGRPRWEKPSLRAGERRRDGDESGARDTSRNSPLSMCFDEAVAIATMRREKEKVGEKDKDRQRDWGQEVQ